MFKKFLDVIKDTIKEEYKFIIALIIIYFIFQIPLNYYIIVGGGISDVESRIEVENSNSSKGSFNISYVEELKGTLLTYGLSYIIPTWERESANDYKYTEKESIADIEFRSDLDLTAANEKAKYWAYTLANKEIKEKSSKMYVITILDGSDGTLKVQDQILSIDGQEYDNLQDYVKYIQSLKAGDVVSIKLLRNGREKTVKTKLFEKDGRILTGVGMQQIIEYDTNPKVNIKFKRAESGSSGGLITTLEIYNQLTKKDLTKGKKIAGTGTIEMDGTIGEIGGVEYKLLGASRDNAEVFLVPAKNNYKQALAYKKKHNLKIKLIPVKDIKSAISKLESLE